MNNQKNIELKHGFKNLFIMAPLILMAAAVVSIIGRAKQQIADPGQEEPIQTIENITPEDALALIRNNQNNPEFLIIDIRTPGEFAGGHIENAINIDFHSATFQDDLNQLNKGKTYLIYCRSGRRSGLSIPVMKELGFMEVHHLLGGIISWKAEDLPIVR